MSLLMKITQLLTPPLIDRITKSIIRPKDYLVQKELHRLICLPRYQPTTTTLLGKEIEIVDACSFLGGYYEIFEKKIYQFKAACEQPLIVDCGANIGLSVFFFKTLYPDSKIIAFEPDPQIFNVLQTNIFKLGLTNVELHQKAVWIEEKFIKFCVEGGYSGRIPKPGDENNMVQVKTARLKDLLYSQIDFLKIDIEGAETEVIRDCQEQLVNVDHLFIEYHSHQQEKQSLHELLTIVHDAGFRYHILGAFTSQKPFVDRTTMLGMDLQLDIFCYRG
jgi:FkbM family methyltransferase